MASVSPRNRGWIAQARGGFRRGAPLKAAACRMACRMVTPDRHAGCCGEERRFGWANFESTDAVGSAVCERGQTGS